MGEAYAGKYSPLSDIFAVGVIAYKMMGGKFPFAEDIFEGGGANWAGSPQMAVIRQRLKVSTIEYASYSNFTENPLAQDLVARMLSYNELHAPQPAWHSSTLSSGREIILRVQG